MKAEQEELKSEMRRRRGRILAVIVVPSISGHLVGIFALVQKENKGGGTYKYVRLQRFADVYFAPARTEIKSGRARADQNLETKN
jgi:hypothetical protein